MNIYNLFDAIDNDGLVALIVTAAIVAGFCAGYWAICALWEVREPILFQAWDDFQDWRSDWRERRQQRAHDRRATLRVVGGTSMQRRIDARVHRGSEVSDHATGQALQGAAHLGAVHGDLHQFAQVGLDPDSCYSTTRLTRTHGDGAA